MSRPKLKAREVGTLEVETRDGKTHRLPIKSKLLGEWIESAQGEVRMLSRELADYREAWPKQQAKLMAYRAHWWSRLGRALRLMRLECAPHPLRYNHADAVTNRIAASELARVVSPPASSEPSLLPTPEARADA